MRTTKLFVVCLSVVFATIILASCGTDPIPKKDTPDVPDGDSQDGDVDVDVTEDLLDTVGPEETKDTAEDKDTPVDPPDEISELDEISKDEEVVEDQCLLSCETVADCAGAFDDLDDCELLACAPVASCEEDDDEENDKQCVKKELGIDECCTTDQQCQEADTSICTCNEKCVNNQCESDQCDPLPEECCKNIVLHKFNFDNIDVGGMPSPDLMTQNTHTTKLVKWSVKEGPCGSNALYLGDPDCGLYFNGQTDDVNGKCTPVSAIACTEANEKEKCPEPSQSCDVPELEVDGSCVPDPTPERVWVELTVPEINLPNDALYVATFRLWMDAENTDDLYDPGEDKVPDTDDDVFLGTIDRLKVFVDLVGGSAVEPDWTSHVLPNNGTDGECMLVSIDLSSHAGKSISLRLDFDTLDGTANDYQGIYIDDFTVRSYCGKDICTANSECDDDFLCTDDNCILFADQGGIGVCDNFQEDEYCTECMEPSFCQGKGPHPDDIACFPPTCSGGSIDPEVIALCQWLPNPACCNANDLPAANFDNGFESGDLSGYEVEEMPVSGGIVWHLNEGAGYNESPDVEDADEFAAQFSNAAGDSYDCGFSQCKGSLSTTVDLTNAPDNAFVKLTFMLNLSTEWDGIDPADYNVAGSGIDVLRVYAVNDGEEKKEPVWESHDIFGTTNGETLPMWADLSGSAGKNMTLIFEFDTGDATPPKNDFAGPIIDEIVVESVCDEVCSAADECDSGGVCDLPQCLGGVCDYGTPVPECCITPEDPACNDSNACTTDSCLVQEQQCLHVFTNDPQCCSPQAFIMNDNFEDPANFNPLQDNYPANNTWTVPAIGDDCGDGDCQESEESETCPADCNQAPVSWHLVDFDQFSGSAALYFGNPETQTYDSGDSKSFGTIRSPAFQMPPYGTPKVSFKLKLDTEHCASWATFAKPQIFDILTLSVVAGDDVDNEVWSGPVKIWDSMAWDIKGCTWDQVEQAAVWKTVEVGLGLGADEMANLKGKALRFEFKFWSEDKANNAFLGALIDDFSVDVICDSNCYSPYDCPETNMAEPNCTIETCNQGSCGATSNPLQPDCCIQNELAGYDFEACSLDGWTPNPPAGQPRWQHHTGQKKSGSCALYFGNPTTGNYDNFPENSSGCVTSPIVDLTDPDSDVGFYYSEVEVSYWFWLDVEEDYFWADSYELLMDQVVVDDPVGIEKTLLHKPCSQVSDPECSEEPIGEPCDLLGCETLTKGQWVYKSFILDVSDYDWIPISPYRAVFKFCFDSGDANNNEGEGLYIDDFKVRTLCQP